MKYEKCLMHINIACEQRQLLGPSGWQNHQASCLGAEGRGSQIRTAMMVAGSGENQGSNMPGVATCSSSGGWLGPRTALIYTQSWGASGHTVKKPSRTGAFSPPPLPQGLLIRRTSHLKEGGSRELRL